MFVFCVLLVVENLMLQVRLRMQTASSPDDSFMTDYITAAKAMLKKSCPLPHIMCVILQHFQLLQPNLLHFAWLLPRLGFLPRLKLCHRAQSMPPLMAWLQLYDCKCITVFLSLCYCVTTLLQRLDCKCITGMLQLCFCTCMAALLQL